ncbi:MAG: synthase gamma subunit [Francisellaceae bacterium]|nr:synthase gamma subunit [Francisellaceae bacterium]
MSNTKEIRSKIKTIKSTQKITRAMQMVAASKMRKAQERMSHSKPYAARIKNVINHLATGRLEYHHSYLIERTPKKVGFIVVATDRGLCGGLNVNLFKTLITQMKIWKQQDVQMEFCSIGKKAENFFNQYGGNLVATINQLSESPGIEDLIGLIKVMLNKYENQEIDRLYLVSNKFVNTMTQTPEVELLLPIISAPQEKQYLNWDYLYEPNPEVLLNSLLFRYIESVVYQGVVENIACEQSARMVAMKNASDNAGDLIEELQLKYNKARQAAITQELSEIVAGADAV